MCKDASKTTVIVGMEASFSKYKNLYVSHNKRLYFNGKRARPKGRRSRLSLCNVHIDAGDLKLKSDFWDSPFARYGF
jgi:hypothetical protein